MVDRTAVLAANKLTAVAGDVGCALVWLGG